MTSGGDLTSPAFPFTDVRTEVKSERLSCVLAAEYTGGRLEESPGLTPFPAPSDDRRACMQTQARYRGRGQGAHLSQRHPRGRLRHEVSTSSSTG